MDGNSFSNAAQQKVDEAVKNICNTSLVEYCFANGDLIEALSDKETLNTPDFELRRLVKNKLNINVDTSRNICWDEYVVRNAVEKLPKLPAYNPRTSGQKWEEYLQPADEFLPREDIFQIAFALKLTPIETAKLLLCNNENPYIMRSPREQIYYYLQSFNHWDWKKVDILLGKYIEAAARIEETENDFTVSASGHLKKYLHEHIHTLFSDKGNIIDNDLCQHLSDKDFQEWNNEDIKQLAEALSELSKYHGLEVGGRRVRGNKMRWTSEEWQTLMLEHQALCNEKQITRSDLFKLSFILEMSNEDTDDLLSLCGYPSFTEDATRRETIYYWCQKIPGSYKWSDVEQLKNNDIVVLPDSDTNINAEWIQQKARDVLSIENIKKNDINTISNKLASESKIKHGLSSDEFSNTRWQILLNGNPVEGRNISSVFYYQAAFVLRLTPKETAAFLLFLYPNERQVSYHTDSEKVYYLCQSQLGKEATWKDISLVHDGIFFQNEDGEPDDNEYREAIGKSIIIEDSIEPLKHFPDADRDECFINGMLQYKAQLYPPQRSNYYSWSNFFRLRRICEYIRPMYFTATGYEALSLVLPGRFTAPILEDVYDIDKNYLLDLEDFASIYHNMTGLENPLSELQVNWIRRLISCGEHLETIIKSDDIERVSREDVLLMGFYFGCIFACVFLTNNFEVYDNDDIERILEDFSAQLYVDNQGERIGFNVGERGINVRFSNSMSDAMRELGNSLGTFLRDRLSLQQDTNAILSNVVEYLSTFLKAFDMFPIYLALPFDRFIVLSLINAYLYIWRTRDVEDTELEDVDDHVPNKDTTLRNLNINTWQPLCGIPDMLWLILQLLKSPPL